jgi:hypothetical protein
MSHNAMTRRKALGSLTALGVSLPILQSFAVGQGHQPTLPKDHPVLKSMLDAALRFLDTLSPGLRDKATLPFEGEERFNWHYFPTCLDSLPDAIQKFCQKRRGVSLQEMTGPQRIAAHALLHSALSSQGYLKATGIMFMEEVLRETELALGRDPKVVTTLRDPELYFFTIFGKPSKDTPWGWRVEGHHLSLHFSSVTGELVAATPMFMGANPAVVAHGTHAALSILFAEAELARELLSSLDGQQNSQAIIAATAPQDIITGNSRKATMDTLAGLPASQMTGIQRSMLMRLIHQYATNFHSDLADGEIQKIQRTGIERIHFAWAGSKEPGKPHYYRIHSPKLLIEYDNTQDNANHIHTVYRDLENDFGEDMLRQHYKTGSHHG